MLKVVYWSPFGGPERCACARYPGRPSTGPAPGLVGPGASRPRLAARPVQPFDGRRTAYRTRPGGLPRLVRTPVVAEPCPCERDSGGRTRKSNPLACGVSRRDCVTAALCRFSPPWLPTTPPPTERTVGSGWASGQRLMTCNGSVHKALSPGTWLSSNRVSGGAITAEIPMRGLCARAATARGLYCAACQFHLIQRARKRGTNATWWWSGVGSPGSPRR